MDMLYYIYIGNDRSTINHLSKVTGGMFMAVSSSNKAAKVIDSIRERYNTSILYEQNEPLKDSQDISFLHKRFPRVYIILITPGLQTESRKVYLQAGVNNTLPPQADEESIRQMTKSNCAKNISYKSSASRTARYSIPSTCLCGNVSSIYCLRVQYSLCFLRYSLPQQ